MRVLFLLALFALESEAFQTGRPSPTTRRSQVTLRSTIERPIETTVEEAVTSGTTTPSAAAVSDSVGIYEDDKHGYACGPSVTYWRDWEAPATGVGSGADNLRQFAQRALSKALSRGDTSAAQYWSYHLARSTFFAAQGAAGVLSYNLQRRRDETASSDDNSGGGLASDMSISVDASAVDEAAAATAQVKSSTTNTGLDHGEEDSGAPSSPLGDLSLMADLAGALLSEAGAAYEQDFAQLSPDSPGGESAVGGAAQYRMPWDMVATMSNPLQERQANPLYLADQFGRFVRESAAVLTRRNRREPSDVGVWLDKSSSDSMGYPEYYLNNFHFQTDGWLSSDSAKVYETSTETLFVGRQDAMQRTALLPLASWARRTGAGAGEGKRLLEVACGTGRVNTFLRDNFPALEVDAVDLSPFYLQEARGHADRWEAYYARGGAARRGANGGGGAASARPARPGPVRFTQANAESLPFEDGAFDAVACVYLFHELPHSARAAAAAEMARVVAPGGVVVLTDSIQKGDRVPLDATLGNFQYLNEPHYPTYIHEDIGQLFADAGLVPDEKHVLSSTKTLSFTKPAANPDAVA